jgi:formylglycine-generating enzyme required for sulfatase activity
MILIPYERPFYLSRFQVTNLDFDQFVSATGREPMPFRNADGFRAPLHPVTGVSWFDADAYCAWLARRTGRPFRLPCEAEWEFAARGGLDGKIFPWGDEPPQSRPDYAERWKCGPEPVGTSAPNGYGLFDMCENVHEWCAEWFDEARTRRASRGGSWRHHIKISRCSARSSIPPEFRYADYGFRVACGAG